MKKIILIITCMLVLSAGITTFLLRERIEDYYTIKKSFKNLDEQDYVCLEVYQYRISDGEEISRTSAGVYYNKETKEIVECGYYDCIEQEMHVCSPKDMWSGIQLGSAEETLQFLLDYYNIPFNAWELSKTRTEYSNLVGWDMYPTKYTDLDFIPEDIRMTYEISSTGRPACFYTSYTNESELYVVYVNFCLFDDYDTTKSASMFGTLYP